MLTNNKNKFCKTNQAITSKGKNRLYLNMKIKYSNYKNKFNILKKPKINFKSIISLLELITKNTYFF